MPTDLDANAVWIGNEEGSELARLFKKASDDSSAALFELAVQRADFLRRLQAKAQMKPLRELSTVLGWIEGNEKPGAIAKKDTISVGLLNSEAEVLLVERSSVGEIPRRKVHVIDGHAYLRKTRCDEEILPFELRAPVFSRLSALAL